MKFTYKQIKDSIKELGLVELFYLEKEIYLELNKRAKKLKKLEK